MVMLRAYHYGMMSSDPRMHLRLQAHYSKMGGAVGCDLTLAIEINSYYTYIVDYYHKARAVYTL